jgi:hypothetical protein
MLILQEVVLGNSGVSLAAWMLSYHSDDFGDEVRMIDLDKVSPTFFDRPADVPQVSEIRIYSLNF